MAEGQQLAIAQDGTTTLITRCHARSHLFPHPLSPLPSPSSLPLQAIAQDNSSTLIIRDGHYGFEPCRGKRSNWPNLRVDYIASNESAILFRPELRELAANMSQSMNAGDYDAVRVRRGDKLNTEMWPHVANDTSPPS
ncbi:unnamed protein product [Closterium sp. Naga37s-1]|nr:unnamed protein product [Closterium sp. Naga37s-1]